MTKKCDFYLPIKYYIKNGLMIGCEVININISIESEKMEI